MTAPIASFNYGFGWFIDSYHGHRLVQHSGGTPGFSSVIYRFIDDKLTIIVLTNHSDMIMDRVGYRYCRHLFASFETAGSKT